MLKSLLQPVLKPVLSGVFGEGSETPNLPVAPVLATPTVTDTTMVLTWTMSDDTGVTDYIVEYKASSSGTWLVFSDGTSSAKTATVTGLTGSTSYDVRVKAVNIAGSGNYSNVQTEITLFGTSSISGLRLWHDANDASSIISSGGLVSKISDKSGFNNHTVQATGSLQPQTGIETLNGKNVITYDGTRTMNLSSELYTIPNSGNTVFIVCKANNTSSVMGFFGISSGGKFWNIRTINATAGYNVNSSSGSSQACGSNIRTTNPIIVTLEAPNAGGTQKIYTNGVLRTTFGVTANITLTVGYLGHNVELVNGYIAEILIYNKQLNGTEMTLVHNYLKSKWNIT